jgi:hypothetical protein
VFLDNADDIIEEFTSETGGRAFAGGLWVVGHRVRHMPSAGRRRAGPGFSGMLHHRPAHRRKATAAPANRKQTNYPDPRRLV